jgi:HK97 family phage portal protein
VAIVRSFGALQSMSDTPTRWYGNGDGSVSLYGSHVDYGTIYKTQPNVRTVVDFLSRNIAQLGLHVFRRVSDNDRVRLPKHELAEIIARPNPAMTRYRMVESLMLDLGIYFNAYWVKIRAADRLGLVRLPACQMTVEGQLQPEQYYWTRLDGQTIPFAPTEIVHFGGYSPFPTDPLRGISPLETLRRILAEEAASGEHREAFWRNSARVEGVVTRPKEKPRYTPQQSQQWREQWQAARAGVSNGGTTVLLQDGETFTPTSWSAKDSEYVSARKLTREECAAAYHVPLPMVGILEHATFSNIVEQHKNLYQDCLGPWLEMIEEEFERQILPECDDTRDVYVEFNIAEKLKGSFEEQAASIQALVGRPVMTPNEGRARLNLPAITDDPTADQLAPQQGGPSDATARPEQPDGAGDATPPADAPAANLSSVITATRDRQTARLGKLPVTDRPAAFTADLDRWNRELAADIQKESADDEKTAAAIAATLNSEVLRQLEDDARDARIVALEQRPAVPMHIDVHPAAVTVEPPVITVHMPAIEGSKAITFQKDASGAVIGAEVRTK